MAARVQPGRMSAFCSFSYSSLVQECVWTLLLYNCLVLLFLSNIQIHHFSSAYPIWDRGFGGLEPSYVKLVIQ